MSEQLTDDEQVEALKKWWKENGTAIIVGIVIGVGAIIGVWKWTEYTETRSLAASALYDEFVTAITDDKLDAGSSYESLKKDYEGTSYAALAALRMAAVDYGKDKADNAVEHLRWAATHPGHDSIEYIARVRLAKMLVSKDQLDEAEKLLKDVSEPAFEAQYAALRGDIHIKRGNIEQARSSYKLALASTSLSGKQREYVQMKLDDLGADDINSSDIKAEAEKVTETEKTGESN